MQLLKNLYLLSKPGIVYGNSIALIAGFFFYLLQSGEWPNLLFFAGALLGTAFVMASACVTNNIFDRDIDAYMERTKNRPLLTGAVSIPQAWLTALILLIAGACLLYVVNITSMYLALAGWVLYAVVYTYLKRKTYHATLVGTLPGAVPPLVGYYASGGDSLVTVSILFLIMVSWQMVHFYAIAIFRQQEYASAVVPVVTEVKGVPWTLEYIKIWAYGSFLALTASLFVAPWTYGLLMVALIGWWIHVTDYTPGDDVRWSRIVFFSSLKFIVAWLLVIIICALVGLL